MESSQKPTLNPATTPPPLSTTTVINRVTPSSGSTATTPPVVTGTVVNQASTPATAVEELSGAAQAGIGTAIGVGNVCCGPVCNTCPTIISSGVGIALYYAWKKDRPKTAKNILMVTLITGGIGLAIFAVLFFAGLASSMFDSLSNY